MSLAYLPRSEGVKGAADAALTTVEMGRDKIGFNL